jgi:CHAT domain-containing protein
VPRADRLLYPAALLCAALIGLGLLRRGTQVLAAGPEGAPVAEASAQLKSEIASQYQDLAAFRAGDDARLPALRERAGRICQRWQRCDVVDVAEYYAGLDRAARLRGLEDEARYLALRARVTEARDAALDAEAWQVEREEILFRLEELASSIPPFGDRVPAAYATQLAASLRIRHLCEYEQLSLAEREGKLAELESDIAHSLAIFVRAGMVRPRIELDWIDGLRARITERPEDAEARFARCLETARALDERNWQQRALLQLHDLAQEAGDLPRVQALIGELAALEPGPLHWGIACRHATELVWSDQPERAAEFLRAHEPPAGDTGADQHALLSGHCLLRTGEVEGALAAYARIGPRSRNAREARLSEARALLVRGSAAEALARVESTSSGGEGELELRNAWLTLHAEILLTLGRRAQAIRELHVALEGAANAQALMFEERDSSRTTNIFGEVLGLHAVELLARAELEEGDALGAACTIESAQASGLRLVRGGAVQRALLSRGDLAAWARHFELGLVTWVVGADESLVVLVAPDGSARGQRIPRGRRALQEAVRRLREAVLAGDERRRERLGSELGSVLLPGALRDELVARAGTRPARLCCLLHGPLEALPIEALEDSTWLADTIVPAVLPGLPASAPAEGWDASLAARWRLLGDPCGPDGERLLPGAREELDGIARLRPGSALATGPAFDREHLAAALASGDCLHIATHVRHGGGSGSLRTDRARFALSNDAEFGIGEVAGLAPRAALVVLTGCETGGGRFADAEGLQGLARAFLEGGTRNLVTTSWPVEDRWARAFALALQRSLATGLPPSRACAEARRGLRAQGAPCSEWAAFRLLGQD